MKYLSALFLLMPFWLSAQTISITASDTSVCSGIAITFTATTTAATPHYQWTKNGVNVGSDQPVYVVAGPNNADSIACLLVNAAHDTIYAAATDVVVTVLSHPDAGVITGRDSVCPGDSIHLLSSVPGGAWLATNPHASVYSGWVAGISAGHFECSYAVHDSILYVVTNQCGSDTAVKYITIMPIPNAYFEVNGINGSSAICMGPWSGTRLSSGVTDFLCEGYATSRNGKASVGADGTVWGTAAGVDTIINVSSNICGTSVYQVQVTVIDKPAPAVITPAKISVCNGQMDSVVITYSGLVNNLYFNSSIDSVKYIEQVFAARVMAYVYGRNAGNDAARVRLYNMCGFTDTSFAVEVKEQPASVIATDTTCAGYTTVLADNTAGGQWSVLGANGTIQNSNMLLPSSGGIQTVRYTLPNGCFAQKEIQVDNCTAEFEVAPIPTHGSLNIHTFVNVYDSYSIVNALGQITTTQPLTGAYTTADISALSPGIYFLRLSANGKKSKTIKVVKY